MQARSPVGPRIHAIRLRKTARYPRVSDEPAMSVQFRHPGPPLGFRASGIGPLSQTAHPRGHDSPAGMVAIRSLAALRQGAARPMADETTTATAPETPRVALVTGGADGIGWAVARRFAAGGCRVAIADLREEAAAARARELGGAGHLAVAADVSSEPAVCAMVTRAVEHFGRLDVLVNNAGVADSFLPTTEQTGEAFGRLLDIHLRGTFLASREAARVMLRQRQGGAIVNFSSIAGLTGLPRRNAYGAAKAGIVALTRSMASEWARRGIRVNAVAPGYVRTALVEELERTGKLDTAALERRTPIGRLAQPEEIAEAVWFLASPQASYVTGAVLGVDGGWHAFGAAGDPPS